MLSLSGSSFTPKRMTLNDRKCSFWVKIWFELDIQWVGVLAFGENCSEIWRDTHILSAATTRKFTKLTNQHVSYAFTSSPFSFHARHILPMYKFQHSYSCTLLIFYRHQGTACVRTVSVSVNTVHWFGQRFLFGGHQWIILLEVRRRTRREAALLQRWQVAWKS